MGLRVPLTLNKQMKIYANLLCDVALRSQARSRSPRRLASRHAPLLLELIQTPVSLERLEYAVHGS